MAETSETLSLDELVEINRQAIDAFGGSFYAGDNNLINPGTLIYTLDSLDAEVFGNELYPAIEEKAAVLGWNIIAKHVFHDGNKRTGILACITFLELNGYDLQVSFEDIDAEVVNICEGIAKQKISLEVFTNWIKNRI